MRSAHLSDHGAVPAPAAGVDAGSEDGLLPARPLRIGIGLDGLQLGGSVINALDLAKEFERRGHEVVVFAIHHVPSIPVAPLAEKLGISLHVLPADDHLFLQARHIATFARDHQFDVVHVFAPWMAAPATLALRPSPRTALVVTNWTMENSRGLPPMTPLLLGTEALREEAASKVRAAPVWLLEPPVDTRADEHSDTARVEFRRTWAIEAGTTLLVIVSRLDRHMKAEGIANAIQSIRRLADPSLQLAIVGGGDAEILLGELAEEVNTALGWRAVVMTGPLHDPRPAYSAADLVLAMGGSALRALAFGKPLVVLGEDGFSLPFTPHTLSYFLRNGYYGRGTAGDPVDALCQHVLTVLDLANLTDLAAWGRQVMLARYSLNIVADRLFAMYREARRQSSRPRRQIDTVYVAASHQARQVRRVLASARASRARRL